MPPDKRLANLSFSCLSLQEQVKTKAKLARQKQATLEDFTVSGRKSTKFAIRLVYECVWILMAPFLLCINV